jgi:hypothetical protein
MFVDITQFVFSGAELVREMQRLKFLDFYNGSYQDDVKFIFWWPTLYNITITVYLLVLLREIS